MSFNSLPVWEMLRRGREATRRRLRFLLFQKGFDFVPVLFLLFYSLLKGKGLFGCSEPRVEWAFAGRHLWNPYK